MSPDAGTNVVDVYVNYLRKKLGAARSANAGPDALIETIRGEGYAISMAGVRKPVGTASPAELRGPLGAASGGFGPIAPQVRGRCVARRRQLTGGWGTRCTACASR